MQWEQADPPWELPKYVSNLMWDLQETKAWIATSGAAVMMNMEPARTMPLMILKPSAQSDGESEIGMSDEELPTP